MDEKRERELRRKAVQLSLRGLTPRAFLEQIQRSQRWLFKWLKCFAQGGWDALKSQGRQPCSIPGQYAPQAHGLVARARRQLEKRKVGLVGARSIQRELRRAHLLRKIPAEATIYRWLHADGVLKTARRKVRAVYLPQPTLTWNYILHLMDWTARYLEGGTKVYAFHTVQVLNHALRQTISPDKTYAAARQHALEAWKTLELPDGLPMDNDAAFSGGHKAPRIISPFSGCACMSAWNRS